jgi:hypothetical protein
MNPDRMPVRRLKTCTLLVAALFAIGATGAFAARGLSEESAQARNLVNQGQVDLTRGDRAHAILGFERARLLAPRSNLVRSTLAASPAADIAPVARAVGWITPNEWSCMAVAFGWIAGLSLAVAIAGTRGGCLARRLAFGSGVAFVLSMGGVVESNLASRALAVVTRPTGVLVAPYDGAGATADLRAGAVVVLGPRYGGFVQVRGPDDARGWVASGVVEPVVGASL